MLGIKIRQSPDIKEGEKRRKNFEAVLQQIADNKKELKHLTLPSEDTLPIDSYYQGLLTALAHNRSLTVVDASSSSLSPDQLIEVLKVLNDSNNFALRRIDFSGAKQTSDTVRAIYKYVKQHLHISDFKFKDPILDTSYTPSDQEKLYSVKITHYLESNRNMQKFLKGETTKFECPCRSIVVTQGFIKQDWAKRMTGLDLTGNRLFHLPTFFVNFSLLTELLLANNDLCKLPRWIGKLINLRVLDATNNSVRSIPDSCYQLENLHTLNLSKNNISKMPLFLGHMPKLIVLSVSSNPIMNVPSDIIRSAEYGNPCMIQYLRRNLDLFVMHQIKNENLSVPPLHVIPPLPDEMYEEEELNFEALLPTLSPFELSSINNRKNQILEQREFKMESYLSASALQIIYEPKELSSLIEPSCNAVCSAIAKVSDSIWCGTNKGSVYVWDSRTCRYSNKLDLHDHKVVCIIEVPYPHIEAWSADTSGMVNIYDLRKKKAMKLEIFEVEISTMTFVKESEEMWVASGTSIFRVSIRTRGILSRSIAVDAPIRGMTTCGKHIWTTLETGTIIIFCTDGTQLRSFRAHSEPIVAICNTSDFIWTATQSEIKIWKIQVIKFGVFIVACHDILSAEHYSPPFVASKDQFVFTVGGSKFPGTVMQLTSSGELTNCFSNQHPHTDQVNAITFTVSPDRLWSVAGDGNICYYELKRGKKTIQRLQEQNIEGELGIVTDVKSLESLRLETSDSDDELAVNFVEEGEEPPPPHEPHPKSNISQFEELLATDPVLSVSESFLQPKTRVSMVEWDSDDE